MRPLVVRPRRQARRVCRQRVDIVLPSRRDRPHGRVPARTERDPQVLVRRQGPDPARRALGSWCGPHQLAVQPHLVRGARPRAKALDDDQRVVVPRHRPGALAEPEDLDLARAVGLYPHRRVRRADVPQQRSEQQSGHPAMSTTHLRATPSVEAQGSTGSQWGREIGCARAHSTSRRPRRILARGPARDRSTTPGSSMVSPMHAPSPTASIPDVGLTPAHPKPHLSGTLEVRLTHARPRANHLLNVTRCADAVVTPDADPWAQATRPAPALRRHDRADEPPPPPPADSCSMASRPAPQAPRRRGAEAARQHPGPPNGAAGHLPAKPHLSGHPRRSSHSCTPQAHLSESIPDVGLTHARHAGPDSEHPRR